MSEICSLKIQDSKNRHFGTIAQLCRAVSFQLRHVSKIGKNSLNIDTSPTCPHNMVNFGILMAEISWRVCGTPSNFNGFHVLAALLHGTLVVGVSQTLRRWTEGATYIRQGDHHVGHRPTFCSSLRINTLLLSTWVQSLFPYIKVRWIIYSLVLPTATMLSRRFYVNMPGR